MSRIAAAGMHGGLPGVRSSGARGCERVGGVGVVDHLDDLAVAEGREVRDHLGLLALLGGRPHDDDDLVAGVDDVDQLAYSSARERVAHELEGLAAVVTRAGRVRVASVPPDVGREQRSEDLEVPASRGLPPAPGQLHVRLGHGPDYRSAASSTAPASTTCARMFVAIIRRAASARSRWMCATASRGTITSKWRTYASRA